MEPVTLADIKVQLRLDPGVSDEDAQLESLIVAARRACELRTRRTIVGEDAMLVLRAFPAGIWASGGLAWRVPPAGYDEIALPGGTVTAVAVRYFDGDGLDQLLAPDSYRASLATTPALLQPVSGWPAAQVRPDAVRIAYTLSPMAAGELEMARHAIRLIVRQWYDGCGVDERLPRAAEWLLDALTAFGE